MPARNRPLVPQAEHVLDQLKWQVLQEHGPAPGVRDQATWEQWLDRAKYEVAHQLGLTPYVQGGYWGHLPSRLNGAVGGRIGGHIGGQMVRRLIALAEQQLGAGQPFR